MKRNPQITPRWLTLEGAAVYSGLSKKTIENYVNGMHVVAANVIIPGNTRGRRLVDRESLDAFIEKFIAGPAKPSEPEISPDHFVPSRDGLENRMGLQLAKRGNNEPNRPEWMDAKGISRRFGLCRSTLYRLAADGKIRTCSLRERGMLRGKRLFSTDSISYFLESRATGGSPYTDAARR